MKSAKFAAVSDVASETPVRVIITVTSAATIAVPAVSAVTKAITVSTPLSTAM